jgi:hypothetical protein
MPVRSIALAISAFAIAIMLALFTTALLYGNYSPAPAHQAIGSNWIAPAAIVAFAVVAALVIVRTGRDSQH